MLQSAVSVQLDAALSLSLMQDTPDFYGLIRFIDDIVDIVVLDRDKPYLTFHRVQRRIDGIAIRHFHKRPYGLVYPVQKGCGCIG